MNWSAIGRVWLLAIVLIAVLAGARWMVGPRDGARDPLQSGPPAMADANDARSTASTASLIPGMSPLLDPSTGTAPAVKPGGMSPTIEPAGTGRSPGAAGAEGPTGPGAEPERYSAPIGRGGSLFKSMLAAGVSSQAAQPFLESLGEVVKLRRLGARDQVTIDFAVDGSVRRVGIDRGPVERYEAITDGDEVMAYRLEIEVETRVRRFTGVVETSLYEAVLGAGGDPDVVVRMADLLAWDVDFFTDPRPGDRFDVLVEERWLEGRRIGGGPILMVIYDGERASQTACRYVLSNGSTSYFDADGKSLRKALLKSPLNYRRISSTYSHSRRHPITKRYRPHHGVDFAAPVGTPVVSVGDGTVLFAARKGANGNIVIIRHTNKYETYYLHLSGFGQGVRKGAKIKQGQVIGYVGSTGRSTGPHLDFRVKKHGRFINPLKLTLPPGPPVPGEEVAGYRDVRHRYACLMTSMESGALVAVESNGLRLGGHLQHLGVAGDEPSVFGGMQ